MRVSYFVCISMILSTILAGCGLSPYQLDDPATIVGQGPLASDVVRSIRCEVVTFLVANKLRSAYHLEQEKAMNAAKIQMNEIAFNSAIAHQKEFPFIPIDSTQYAEINVDLKNVDTASLSLGFDWKKIAGNKNDLNDYHFGPSYSETNTFELIETLGLPQNADLGPSKEYVPFGQKAAEIGKREFNPATLTGAYFNQTKDDADFFCYSPLKKLNPHNEDDVMGNIQSLVVGDDISQQLSNYPRIHIGDRKITLSEWLQKTAADIVKNQTTVFSTPEGILSGQMEYTFTLDIKPSIDGKYTLVAGVINPLVPEISGAIEHSGQFAIYLNTPYSLYAFGAKQGNSCNPDLPYAKAHLINPFNTSCKAPATSPAPGKSH